MLCPKFTFVQKKLHGHRCQERANLQVWQPIQPPVGVACAVLPLSFFPSFSWAPRGPGRTKRRMIWSRPIGIQVRASKCRREGRRLRWLQDLRRKPPRAGKPWSKTRVWPSLFALHPRQLLSEWRRR